MYLICILACKCKIKSVNKRYGDENILASGIKVPILFVILR